MSDFAVTLPTPPMSDFAKYFFAMSDFGVTSTPPYTPLSTGHNKWTAPYYVHVTKGFWGDTHASHTHTHTHKTAPHSSSLNIQHKSPCLACVHACSKLHGDIQINTHIQSRKTRVKPPWCVCVYILGCLCPYFYSFWPKNTIAGGIDPGKRP